MESLPFEHLMIGMRLLIAEENALVAFDMVQFLEQCGCIVVGLFCTLGEAIRLSPTLLFDAAILGSDFEQERVSLLASQIEARGIPYLIVTARRADEISPSLRPQRLVQMPFRHQDLASALMSIAVGGPAVKS